MRKTRSLLKKSMVFLCSSVLLMEMTVLKVSANSAQYYWSGTTASGAIVTDDTCPVIVEKEKLTFVLEEFPKYYSQLEEYLDYSGNVTAEYTFCNPADYKVSTTLVFPFGTIPDYGVHYDRKTGEMAVNEDTEKYKITVDGAEVEKTLRHTLSLPGAQFELEKDMALLQDTYLEDSFYSPDLPVTRYTYLAQNVDTETYDAATAAFVVSADPEKTKVLMEDQNGGKKLEDGVRLESWVHEETFTVNVIGEPFSQMPEWKFYEDGACEKEIGGAMTLVSTEAVTLKEFTLSQYDETSGILEHDWYNAVVESMKELEWSSGAIFGGDFQFDVSDRLMRWYEYQVTLEPGEKAVNTVTAPIYPSFRTDYEPPIYQYTYLLTPAQSWASFGTLDISIQTPYYMTEDGLGTFEPTSSGYECHLSSLPEEELTFTLSTNTEPSAPAHFNTFPMGTVFVTVLILLTVLILVITAARAKRKKNKERNPL